MTMNGIFTIDFSNHLVAALLHTLWQGAAIAAVLWVLLRAMPARQATARYSACVAALLTIVVAFSVTWRLTDRTALVFSASSVVNSSIISLTAPASTEPSPAAQTF